MCEFLSLESNKTRRPLHICFIKSKLRLGQAAYWQLFSQASMFNMFTALDGLLLEEGYVVFVSGVVNPMECKCMINWRIRDR